MSHSLRRLVGALPHERPRLAEPGEFFLPTLQQTVWQMTEKDGDAPSPLKVVKKWLDTVEREAATAHAPTFVASLVERLALRVLADTGRTADPRVIGVSPSELDSGVDFPATILETIRQFASVMREAIVAAPPHQRANLRRPYHLGIERFTDVVTTTPLSFDDPFWRVPLVTATQSERWHLNLLPLTVLLAGCLSVLEVRGELPPQPVPFYLPEGPGLLALDRYIADATRPLIQETTVDPDTGRPLTIEGLLALLNQHPTPQTEDGLRIARRLSVALANTFRPYWAQWGLDPFVIDRVILLLQRAGGIAIPIAGEELSRRRGPSQRLLEETEDLVNQSFGEADVPRGFRIPALNALLSLLEDAADAGRRESVKPWHRSRAQEEEEPRIRFRSHATRAARQMHEALVAAPPPVGQPPAPDRQAASLFVRQAIEAVKAVAPFVPARR